MRKWQILASILTFLVVSSEAQAGDREDVLAYMDGVYTAVNASEWDALVHFLSQSPRYDENGGLLRTVDPEASLAWLKSSGVELNIRPSHQNVDVYGNAAVFTCYETIQRTFPNEEPWNATLRITVVLAKIKGDWQHVHVHVSHLTPVNPE